MDRPTQKRDRVLTEKVIRGCGHEWPKGPASRFQGKGDLCKKCGGVRSAANYIDFSTWQGLAELWEPLKQRECWGDFWIWLTQKFRWDDWELKTPSQKADVVFEFLQDNPEGKRDAC